MSQPKVEVPEKPVFNLIGFLLILFLAWIFKWQTTELVWSLWLGSLLLGYASILSTIGAALIMLFKVVRFSRDGKMATAGQRASIVGIGSVVALFFLAFFSFHFCAFHAGHAAILEGFFPLKAVDIPKSAFFDSFMNPLRLLWIAVSKIAPLYGWFLLAALLVEWRKILGPLLGALRFQPTEENAKFDNSLIPNNPFFSPYLNVMRMHFLIFFFAGAHFLKLDNFLVYAVVYAIYFFPWSMLRKRPPVMDQD